MPGVTDPNEATNIVRKGRLTYQQAVNLTKPGTIESLSYDALTGAVTCSCALGITFVATVFLTWRRTGDLKQAIQSGASAGLQVSGVLNRVSLCVLYQLLLSLCPFRGAYSFLIRERYGRFRPPRKTYQGIPAFLHREISAF